MRRGGGREQDGGRAKPPVLVIGAGCAVFLFFLRLKAKGTERREASIVIFAPSRRARVWRDAHAPRRSIAVSHPPLLTDTVPRPALPSGFSAAGVIRG